ncbi:17000_t:CDS:2, partial [Acaulospora colombiana]
YARYARISWYSEERQDYADPEKWKNGLLTINRYLDEKAEGNNSYADILHAALTHNWIDYPCGMDYGVIGAEEENWLKCGTEVAILCILFKTLTNLLEIYFCAPDNLFDALASCPGKPLVKGFGPTEEFLPNIRMINRRLWPVSIYPSSLFLESIFWLQKPGITSFLFCTGLAFRRGIFQIQAPPVDQLIGTSNVQLFRSIGRMRWSLIELILKLPKRLTTIEFPALQPCIPFDDFDDRPQEWFHHKFLQSLRQHARSLRTLSIRLACWRELVPTGITHLTFGNMLLEFTQLEYLTASIDLFSGADPNGKLISFDALPPSIRRLVIWRPGIEVWDDSTCIHALKIGLENIVEKCPSIREIVCQCFEDKGSSEHLRSLVDPPLSRLIAPKREDFSRYYLKDVGIVSLILRSAVAKRTLLSTSRIDEPYVSMILACED